MSPSLSELRVAASFMRHAKILTEAVRDIFFTARDVDCAARLADIAKRLDDEARYVQGALAKKEGRS